MSSINLGGFNTTNGSTTALGFLSNLDGDSLIEAILSSQQATIDQTQGEVDFNKEKISAVGELQTLLDRLKTTSNFLRSPPGVLNESNDFFKHTVTNLISSTSIEASNYLSVTSEPGATLNSYTIENITLANAHQIRKDGFTSKTASVVGNAVVADNYQASLGTVSGNVLNATTPITFSNDVQGNKATIDLVFSSDNDIDSDDSIVIGGQDIRFGSTNGTTDVAIGGTMAETLSNVVSYMNGLTSGEESRYTYSLSGTTITITRDVAGSHSEVDTDLALNASFASGDQTVAIGSQGASNNPAGGNLNSLGTDGDQGTVATSAVLEIIFGTENQFDTTDELTIGGTTITFGGTGGSDIDISAASTLDDKIDAIVSYMNSVGSGTESTYTYARNSTGVLTITQDTAGAIADVGNDMSVSANFSTGTTDTTQTVQIGRNYKNNGSVDGSVAKSNSLVSGSVSQNGVDGYAAATKATIDIVIANNNIDANDTITFGTQATFGTDIAVGADLAETLDNIVNYYNNLTSGDATGYKFENNGVDTITITREAYGSGADLALNANFIAGADTSNTVNIGSQGAFNNPAGGTLAGLGTDGVDQTSITDASTTHLTNLSGAITINYVNYIEGTSTADTFTSNAIEFKATVGGETYTSKPVYLDGGDINGTGDGTNGLGNRVPSGTVITFVKDTDSESTDGTKDVTFQLVVGDERTNIQDASDATDYGTEINTWLNTTNTITITQSPTVPEFRAGTFNLGGVDITLEEGDNLNVVKSKINAVSALSGVQADIVQISDSNFSLVLKATAAGVENKIFEFSDGDVGDGPTGTIQIGLDNVTFTQTQAASDSSFDLDGQTITRSTNTINDVIDNLTFTLRSDTPVSTTVTLGVESDNDLIKTGINDFLTAYNDLKIFIAEQTERDENNELVEGAVLGDDSILRDVLNAVDAQLTRTVQGISSTGFNSLFEVGIDLIDFPGSGDTPEVEDIFVIDDDKFDAALAANFDAVREVFAFSFTSNSPDLSVFSHTNKTTLTDYVLDIDTTRDDGDKVRVLSAADNSFLFNATLDGSTIRGQAGTGLEGLVLVYTGDGSDTITVSQSIGITDGLYNLLDGYLEEDGFIDDVVDSLRTDNERLLERIERDNISLEIERRLLVEEFTRLEAVISSANNTLSFLESQRLANAENS